ncbi:hypothetical protein LINPERHAP2_LOCUS14654 [Linum perenne]
MVQSYSSNWVAAPFSSCPRHLRSKNASPKTTSSSLTDPNQFPPTTSLTTTELTSGLPTTTFGEASAASSSRRYFPLRHFGDPLSSVRKRSDPCSAVFRDSCCLF